VRLGRGGHLAKRLLSLATQFADVTPRSGEARRRVITDSATAIETRLQPSGDALERADLEAMMAVWAEDEEIVCVHPTGPRLAGHEQVRESWRQIFAGGGGVRINVTHP
jgi:hypothetical protein